MELRCFCVFLDNSSSNRFILSRSLLSLVFLFLLVDDVEALQVLGGNVRVVLGGTAVLPCKLIDTDEPLQQISWQRRTREKVLTDNFYTIQPSGPVYVNGIDRRFEFIGSFKDSNGTLQLTNVLLKDEGTYTCIFTVFPSGNHKTEIPLNVFVIPSVSVKDEYPVEGDEERPLATCTAAGSRPPAQVSWITGTLGDKVRAETSSITNDEKDTTTTVSTLWGKPTRDMNGQEVQCVVKSEAEEKQTFTIQVNYPPVEVMIVERSPDTLECQTDSNPHAKFTWSRSGQSLPQSSVAEGAVLTVSSDLNGLYQCEASNQFGKKQAYIYIHKTSGFCTACWVLFTLLLLTLLVIGAAAVYFLKLCPRLWESNRAEESGPHGPQRVPSSDDEHDAPV